jgi:hypothetical protein
MNRPTDNAGMGRRQFLKSAALAPLALSLADPKLAQASLTARARSVVLVWLWGGPSQLDMFDPKPMASDSVRSPFQTIRTRTTGLLSTEILPKLADRSNRFAVIRSSVLAGNHDLGVLTGKTNSADAARAPHFGSIIAKHRRSAALPPFMLIKPPGFTSGAGFPRNVAGPLGSAYDPFSISCASNGRVDFGEFNPLDPREAARLEGRRLLRSHLTSAEPQSSLGRGYDAHWEQACRMLTTREARQAFELDREREQLRDTYGRTSFGQSMLLTRRLVEAGVPFIWTAFNSGTDGLEEGAGCGWDTHYNNFELMADWLGPIFDRGFSAFLDDLHQRGLLDSTLVVAMGEMGRTPGINGSGGRDHWGSGFTIWAGAGVQGGRVLGETDATASRPITLPVTTVMMGTTMAELAGVDAQVRAEMGVLQGGSVIDELF